jgi:putative component of toxin-antitoxin plasmid stabilization module
MREKIMVILLAGGTKRSQQKDIKKVIDLAKEF